jgi:mannitol/fructose-specific phosphotransferase system IIA component (Ntr-type)
VKTLVAAVALNNIACIVLFEAAHTATLLSFDPAGGGSAWLAPLREIGYALLLGGGIGFALVLGTRHVVRSDRLTTLSLIAILLTAGMAEQLGASPLLASLVLGIVLANLTPDKEEIGHEVFENFESAIFAVFFTLAGMELEFAHLGVAGALAGFVFAGRAVAKLASGTLGMALLPQAGLAVGLMLLVTEDPRFPEAMRELVLAVVLTVVTLNELVGPVLARIALARSGDLGKDRPRLIDFIHEEHIVTGFEAATVEGAIERLADLLVRMNDLSGQRDRILASAIERERQGSTCLGHGLAVPHADLEQGDSILGVMGISRKGLPFETPDGEPVHCMVLLATPPGQRDHRLEVLAAFATAILKDRGIEKQLYRAKSPAHAYELLHHEESEDFNHFLEE